MIRRRLVAAILGVVAVVTSVAGLVIVGTLEDRLVAGVDRELSGRRSAITPQFGRLGRRPPPRGEDISPFDDRRYSYLSIDADGRVAVAVPGGPADDPDPLPDVAGLELSRAPTTVGSIGDGKVRHRVITVTQPGGGHLVIGLSLADLDFAVRTARRVVLFAGLAAVAATGAIVWLTVRRGLQPIDQMIGTAERIAAGDLSERVRVARPASEVGHLGTALNTMLDRIEEALAARTASEERTRRFAADASHELRTPLTSIRGYAELWRQGARSPEEVATAMGRIERESLRMTRLVEDLLVLARLDQGRPLAREPVDLSGIVADAVAAAGAVEPDRPLSVEVGDAPAAVAGDPHRLRQVVDNLLANVRAHTPAGTPAAVRVGREGGSVTLRVTDEGPGMRADEAAHAFDRFWQGRGDASPEGTGLGLAIVAEIVRAHGGEVGLATAPGAGTTVTVTLPHRPAAPDPGATGAM